MPTKDRRLRKVAGSMRSRTGFYLHPGLSLSLSPSFSLAHPLHFTAGRFRAQQRTRNSVSPWSLPFLLQPLPHQHLFVSSPLPVTSLFLFVSVPYPLNGLPVDLSMRRRLYGVNSEVEFRIGYAGGVAALGIVVS